jgi:hypothetical protein
MNDERLNGKEKSNSLVYSLRELANRYNLDVGEDGTVTQQVEEVLPTEIEYNISGGEYIVSQSPLIASDYAVSINNTTTTSVCDFGTSP